MLEGVTVTARHFRLQKHKRREGVRETGNHGLRFTNVVLTTGVNSKFHCLKPGTCDIRLYWTFVQNVMSIFNFICGRVYWPLTGSRGKIQTASCTRFWCPAGRSLSDRPISWSKWTRWFPDPGINMERKAHIGTWTIVASCMLTYIILLLQHVSSFTCFLVLHVKARRHI